MKDHAVDEGSSASGADGGAEGVEAQLGAEMIGHRPAQQPAGAGVDHCRQVEPAFVSGAFRDACAELGITHARMFQSLATPCT